MRRAIAFMLIVVLTFTPLAWADPVPPLASSSAAPADSSTPALISPLRRGQYAPFSGILFSPRAAASIVTEAQYSRERARIEAASASASADARARFVIAEIVSRNDADQKRLQAALDTEKIRAETAEKQATELAAASPNRTTWVAIGGALGVLTTLLVVFGVNKASN